MHQTADGIRGQDPEIAHVHMGTGRLFLDYGWSEAKSNRKVNTALQHHRLQRTMIHTGREGSVP